MSRETKEKAKALVTQMTLAEKMSQMLYNAPAIERLSIPEYNWWNEALHGVARAGRATVFPQAIGLAATFQDELLYQVADAVSTEGRAKFSEFVAQEDRGIYKGLTYWAPNVNIFRDPRWGRGHETYGEDPYLTAKMGVAYVKGLQGADSDHLKTTACAKHFAVHSGPEVLRHSFDAVASKKDLYETYLYAFECCVKEGKVEAVMGAYNRVNGEAACGSKTLLQDILRKEWGFEGHVVSDCWAINDFHLHHKITTTVAESAGLAVMHGCDLNCGSAFLELEDAYKQGIVTEQAITQAVERLIETRIRLGMFAEYPSPYTDIPYQKVECKEHLMLAQKAAEKSCVLLKNDGILPLNLPEIKKVAVIGPNANSRESLIANYCGTASEYITVVDGIRKYIGDEAEVLYALGTPLVKDREEVLAFEKDRFAEAITTAKQSDVVLLCMGLDASLEGEDGDTSNSYASGDKPDLDLPGLQQELIEAVVAVGKPVVLVLLSGSALAVGWAQDHVNGIVQAWYPGARGGAAIANILFGASVPNGKLPITFYKTTDELPDFCDYSMQNRTYRYMNTEPLYPFGFGLSYAKIAYSDMSLEKQVIPVGESARIRITLENSSEYEIEEPVQVYVKHLAASTTTPHFQLCMVEVVHLMPQQSKTIDICVPAKAFSTVDENGKRTISAGQVSIFAGGQQPDARSQQLTGQVVLSCNLKLEGTTINL